MVRWPGDGALNTNFGSGKAKSSSTYSDTIRLGIKVRRSRVFVGNTLFSAFRAEVESGLNSEDILATKSACPFADAKNTAAITTNRIIQVDYSILVVSHDDYGDWQFICGTTDKIADGRIVALHEILSSHPSVVELADLPLGWQAIRDSAEKPWRRHEQ